MAATAATAAADKLNSGEAVPTRQTEKKGRVKKEEGLKKKKFCHSPPPPPPSPPCDGCCQRGGCMQRRRRRRRQRRRRRRRRRLTAFFFPHQMEHGRLRMRRSDSRAQWRDTSTKHHTMLDKIKKKKKKDCEVVCVCVYLPSANTADSDLGKRRVCVCARVCFDVLQDCCC